MLNCAPTAGSSGIVKGVAAETFRRLKKFPAERASIAVPVISPTARALICVDGVGVLSMAIAIAEPTPAAIETP